jgi:hypothetical protein
MGENKYMRDLKLVVSAILLFAVLAGIGIALTPPPPPPPTVQQHLGLQDISISFLKTNASFTNYTVNGQMACRQCHTSSGTNITNGYNNSAVGGVDNRHHGLVARAVINPMTKIAFACTDCHPTVLGSGTLLDHSCTDCHNGTNFWADTTLGAKVGNFSRPHHINTNYTEIVGFGNPAADRHCNKCHGSFVDNYDDGHYVPSYDTSFMITPWASFKATNTSQPDLLGFPGGNINSLTNMSNVGASPTNGYKVWGGCYSCHLSNYSLTSPIGSNHDNHHLDILGSKRIGGTGYQTNATPFNLNNPNTPGYNVTTGVGSACFVCHVVDTTGSPLELNYTDGGTGITTTDHSGMEVRNSTVETGGANNGIVFNPEPGTTNISFNGTGCEKCHSVASIHNIQYNFVPGGSGPQGLGHINNNVDCEGCHSSWLPADTWTPGPLVPVISSVSPAVLPAGSATTLTLSGSNLVNPDGSYPPVVTVDGIQYTPSSVSETQVIVSIPALKAGTSLLQLVKGGSTMSNLETLEIVSNPVLSSATLTSNKKTTSLTIVGTGFGAKPSSLLSVSVMHSGKLIASSAITTWSTTKIVASFTSGSIAKGDTVTIVTSSNGEAQRQI